MYTTDHFSLLRKLQINFPTCKVLYFRQRREERKKLWLKRLILPWVVPAASELFVDIVYTEVHHTSLLANSYKIIWRKEDLSYKDS